MEQTKKSWEEMTHEERIAENSKFIEAEKVSDLEIINNNFSYRENKGTCQVICKTCNKAFKWSEWGATMTRSLTFAGKHIAQKHSVGKYQFSSPIRSRLNFREWVEKQADKVEQYQLSKADSFKVGDEVINNDGEKGIVVGIIKREDKDGFLLGRFDKELVVVESSKYKNATRCAYQTRSLRKVN